MGSASRDIESSPGRRHAVAIVSTSQGHGSGAESVLAELLSGWGTNNPAICLVSPRDARPSAAAFAAGAPVIEMASRRDALALNLLALLRRVPQLRSACTVHAWHSRGFELAVILSALLGVPATATVHDHPDNLTNGWARRRIMRASMRRLDGVVYVSDAVAKAWRPLAQPRRASVIHNGLVEHRSNRAPGGVARIGFLGMNGPRKGFEIVSEWAMASMARGVQWRFYGDMHPGLTEHATRLKHLAGDAVEFPGRRPAVEIFNEIDVLVHASTEFDSFPTVLLEAARAGIPAVAATVGGAPEIVVNGETGYLFDPRTPHEGFERLVELLSSSERRERMGRAARTRYEQRFTVEEMTRRYAEFWSCDRR